MSDLLQRQLDLADARIRELEAERDLLRKQIRGHCDRIAAQAELLAKRAEAQPCN